MREKEEKSIQIGFLDRLKRAIPSNASLPAEMSDLLEISMDSAYRRLRGDTPLSFEEAVLLSEQFQVPLHSEKAVSGSVQFSYVPLESTIDSYLKFLRGVNDNLIRLRKMEGVRLFYCSQDIPIFHNIYYGHLGSFKQFYWMKSILNVEELRSVSFNPQALPQELHDLSTSIFENYAHIPSTELWSFSTLGSTLRQVKYYWDSGLITTVAEGLLIIKDLEQLLNDMEQYALTGFKLVNGEQAGEHQLYLSEIELTTNSAMVSIEEQTIVFLSHHTFNMMQTAQSAYGNETKSWFKGMLNRATLISTVGEKHRFQFFKSAREQIGQLAAYISKDNR